MSIVALWALVLVETGLLLLLLHTLGKLRQQGYLPSQQIESLAVGEQAPQFTALNQEGKGVSLDDFQGQRRLLVFISPGCPACSLAIELLNNFQASDKEIVALVLGDIDHQLNRSYAVEQGACIDILTPVSSKLKESYRLSLIPFAYLLDEAGVIRAKGFFTHREHLESLVHDAFPVPLVVG